MSVYMSRPSNRLLTSSSIRSGTATTRQRFLSENYGGAGWAAGTFVGLVARCAAIIGLFIGSYFLFRPAASDAIAKPTDLFLDTAVLALDDGVASIERANGRLVTANRNSELLVSAGDMIIAEDGEVVLTFTHGQRVTLAPGASLTIEQLERETVEGRKSSQRAQLVLWSGSLAYTSAKESAQEDYFYVSSPSSASTVEQGTLQMDVVSPVQTNYTMLDGSRAMVQMRQQSIQLEAAQKLAAILGDPLVIETTPSQTVETVANQTTRATTTNAANATEFSAPTQTHVVQAGDTLWSIAQKYNIAVEALMIANPSITNAELLWVDQQIYIPTAFAATTTLVTAN